MNPSSPTQKTGPTLVRDVSPPTETNTEVVSDIPVKSPLGPANATNTQPIKGPVAQVFKPSGDTASRSDDKELDHILQDVNSSVKRTEDSIEAKFEHLSGVRKKAAIKKAKLDEAHHGSPPIMATITACLLALALIAAAFMVYQKGY